MLIYAIYGMLSRGPHCGAYYSNCAVIGHFTCQTAISLGRAGCRIVTGPFFSQGGWGLGLKLRCRWNYHIVRAMQFPPVHNSSYKGSPFCTLAQDTQPVSLSHHSLHLRSIHSFNHLKATATGVA